MAVRMSHKHQRVADGTAQAFYWGCGCVVPLIAAFILVAIIVNSCQTM